MLIVFSILIHYNESKAKFIFFFLNWTKQEVTSATQEPTIVSSPFYNVSVSVIQKANFK